MEQAKGSKDEGRGLTCAVRTQDGSTIPPRRRQLTFRRMAGSTGVSRKYRPRTMSMPRSTPETHNTETRIVWTTFQLLAVLSYVKIKVTSADEQQSDLNPGTYQSPHMNRWEPGSARPDLPCWIFSPPGSRDPPGRHWQHRVCDWERPHSGAHLQPRPCGAPEGSGGN